MTRSNSREQFIQTTARLLRERGYSATAMGDIVSASGSPKGSLFFHFPGGKEELASLAVADAGRATGDAIRSALAAENLLTTSGRVLDVALASGFGSALRRVYRKRSAHRFALANPGRQVFLCTS